MSGKYPKGYQIPDKPTIGALSGWNKVTTSRADGTPPQGDHGFTLQDLLKIVKALRDEFNHERLREIEESIERHIALLDNPHQDDLYKMNTSVLQELYLVWEDLGNKGKSREEFLKVLFQYVRIADIETTREGVAHDQVVHALGLKTVIEDHNVHPDAHDIIFATLFPGEPVEASPSFAIEGYVGMPYSAEITRASTMSVYTATGIIQDIPANAIETDYSIGKPCIPIFAEVINQLEESEDLTKAGIWATLNARIERTPGVSDPRNPMQNAFVLKEFRNATPVTHELQYRGETWNITAGEYYTISIFASPMGRDSLGIEIFDLVDNEGRFGYKDSDFMPFEQGTFAGGSAGAVDGKYRFAHFNMKTGEIFINAKASGIHGYMYPLYNGWFRIQLTFRALRSMPGQFRIYTLDIVDGDNNFEGVTDAGVAIFGVVANEGCFLPPYVPSIGGKGRLAPTSIAIPVADWYRYDAGTTVVQFNNLALNAKLNNPAEVYNYGNGGASIAHLCRLPVGNDNRVYFQSFKAASSSIVSKYTQPSKHMWLDVMQGYSYKEHLFGGAENDTFQHTSNCNVNQDVTRLYLGCTRHLNYQMNGFLSHFYYYPEYLKPGNMKFFTGRL